MKKSVYLNSVFAGACFALSLALPAQAESFNIPAGDLQSALAIYMKQTGVHLMISEDAIKGAKTRGVQGDLPADSALTKILSGTGFTLKRDSTGITGIIPQRASQNSNLALQNLQIAQAAPSGRIEEVLVTARKREEAIENIPISITAMSAEDLKSYGVRNFADLEGVVPGLSMGGGGNGVKRDSSPFIRGVGQRETKVTLDPAVATYIEGVYIGRAAGAMLDIVDVDNIQVLRGPQGTLFGRNATGGAISVNLKKPTNDWEASVSTNIGSHGRRDLSGTINIPMIDDTLMGRLTIASTNSNGFFTNTYDNAKWGGDNRITGIAQLRWLPTDRITIDVFGERTRIREPPRPQRCALLRDGFTSTHLNLINGNFIDPSLMIDGYNRYEGLCRRSEALPPSQFASDQTSNEGSVIPAGRYWVDTSTAAVTANWDVGSLGPISDFSVKSISAWRKTRQIADEDLDAVVGTYLIRMQPDFDETIQYSQELTFSGKAFNDRLFVNMGGYYFREETPNSDLILSAGISAPIDYTNFGLPGYYAVVLAEAAKERLQTKNESFAWFGQADFDITPEIQLTGGLRWTRENRWSSYSKSYAEPESLFYTPYEQTATISALLMTIFPERPRMKPALDWTYSNREYFFTTPSGMGPGPADYRLIPNKFIGDQLRFSNEAWTPMASLKYHASDRLLQRFGLDQAMVYATYSQGFHSGGVTAGGIDEDATVLAYPSGTPASLRTNVVADTGIPCPTLWALSPGAPSCVNYLALPEEGHGTADPITFRPEKVTNYEVGFKLTGLDRRVQANLAAFYMDYTDMQTTAVGTRFGVPVPYIENVGKSIIQGVEAELTLMPTPSWRIFMTGSYTDADIKEWLSHVVPLGADGTRITTQPEYDMDRSDERMPRVPRWQFFASSEYNFRLPGGGSITPSAGVRFTSSIYHGFDRGSWVYSYGGYYYNHGGDMPPTSLTGTNSVWRQATGRIDPLIAPSADAKWKTTSRPTAFIDARLSWISDDAKMEAALWGKNLTNKDDYLVGGIPLADITGAVGQVFANPRTFGLTFTYHFGE